jgi:hypothetical protein
MGWTFTIVSGAVLWLLRDVTVRRIEGAPVSPLYRALLWAGAAISGLYAVGAGALAVAGLYDRNGFGPLLTLIFGPLSFGAAACGWCLSWHARYPFPDRAVNPPPAGAKAPTN